MHPVPHLLLHNTKLFFSLSVQTLHTFRGIRAFAVPFRFPKPQWRPFLLASVFLRTRALEWTATGFLIIRPSLISLRIFCPRKQKIKVVFWQTKCTNKQHRSLSHAHARTRAHSVTFSTFRVSLRKSTVWFDMYQHFQEIYCLYIQHRAPIILTKGCRQHTLWKHWICIDQTTWCHFLGNCTFSIHQHAILTHVNVSVLKCSDIFHTL